MHDHSLNMYMYISFTHSLIRSFVHSCHRVLEVILVQTAIKERGELKETEERWVYLVTMVLPVKKAVLGLEERKEMSDQLDYP